MTGNGWRERARRRVRKVLRIARWEVSRSADTIDRRTAVLGLVALVLAGTVVGAGLALGPGNVALDAGIYRVGVAPDSPYYHPVDAAPALAARPPDVDAFRDGDLEILVADDEVRVVDTPKGQAALSTFRSAVQAHNDRLMAAESNQSAAFPVEVTLVYESQEQTAVPGGAGTGGDGGTTGGTGGDSGDGTGGLPSAGGGDDDGDLGVPDFGGTNPFRSTTTGSPADIQPPFPFGSLILAFLFLVPMNFVIQAYGSTILNERINRRGELLLVAPVTPSDIITGKTLPYVVLTLVITTVIAVGVGGGVVSVAAAFPIGLLFLAATFVAGMLARSFKELTFVSVTISVFLTTYAFVPAIFTDVTPIALISPLTLVVRDLQGFQVTVEQYVFSTGTFYVAASVLFLLGAGIYREEDMFTQRPVPLKFLDALDSRLSRPRSVATLSVLLIPFVFIAELLAVAILFALPIQVSIPLLLLAIAAVEEVAKSVHVYAGFAKARFSRTFGMALRLGALSGAGFFLGEKLTVVVQLVGLPDLPLGQAAFAPAGIGVGAAVALLLAPLGLHVVTASITAAGATRDRTWYLGTLVVATVVHALYNLTVVTLVG